MCKEINVKNIQFKKIIRIEINALNLIIKACFNQKHENKWYSIIYFSRKFSSIEQNYDIHDKELLAIITFLKAWKIYAKKAFKFIVLTNHKNLLHFTITKQLNRRQIR